MYTLLLHIYVHKVYIYVHTTQNVYPTAFVPSLKPSTKEPLALAAHMRPLPTRIQSDGEVPNRQAPSSVVAVDHPERGRFNFFFFSTQKGHRQDIKGKKEGDLELCVYVM